MTANSKHEVTAYTLPTGYQVNIQSGSHTLVADEPLDLDGTDQGPNPYDILLSALAACTGITLKMYAKRKDWPLESVSLKLSHEKIYAKDCEDCESKEGKVDKIHIDITLEGDLSDEQKQRLLEISRRCPVHQTLITENKIINRLV